MAYSKRRSDQVALQAEERAATSDDGPRDCKTQLRNIPDITLGFLL